MLFIIHNLIYTVFVLELDLSRLSDDARQRIIHAMVERYGLSEASKILGVSRSYIYQISRGIRGLQIPWLARL